MNKQIRVICMDCGKDKPDSNRKSKIISHGLCYKCLEKRTNAIKKLQCSGSICKGEK